MISVPNPTAEMKAKWGPLAYVTDDERKRIMNLAAMQGDQVVKILQKEIKALAKSKSYSVTEYKSLRRKPD